MWLAEDDSINVEDDPCAAVFVEDEEDAAAAAAAAVADDDDGAEGSVILYNVLAYSLPEVKAVKVWAE